MFDHIYIKRKRLQFKMGGWSTSVNGERWPSSLQLFDIGLTMLLSFELSLRFLVKRKVFVIKKRRHFDYFICVLLAS